MEPQTPHASNRPVLGKLLVVDDEPNIRELLSASLTFSGFQVHSASNGHQALEMIAAQDPDLVILDIMMPGISGLEVARQLRGIGCFTPILFLTAKDSTQDKITGLTVGGDDYVTKPFSLEEVIARIHAILRRTGTTEAAAANLQVGNLVLNQDTHEVYRDGFDIDLSPTEFKLLRYLMLNLDKVLSKDQILDHVWEYSWGGERNIVESYISYLRRKIDTPPPGVKVDEKNWVPLIHTKRGVGYLIRTPQPVA